MKLFSKLFSKTDTLSKIKQHAEKRIKDYTTVSSALKPEDSKMLQDNLDSIARYAKRQNINLEFQPVSKSSDVKMSIYKRVSKQIDGIDGEPMSYLSQDFAGETHIPASMKDKEEFLNFIKTESAKILYGEK